MAGMLRVWPLHDGKPGPPVDLGESQAYVTRIVFSPDSCWLLDRSEEPDSGAVHAHLWRMTMHGGNPTPVERRELRGHDGGVTAVAFAPNGRTLITGGADGDLRRWDLNGRRNWVTGP